jgi:hypothetical protein
MQNSVMLNQLPYHVPSRNKFQVGFVNKSVVHEYVQEKP